ncbi:MAG: hypothetical protein FJZ38_18025 [Candidatus Rokubacteria bacterium]|nr:hypothetical protein [Candidatus Rokubacteria bacterium]
MRRLVVAGALLAATLALAAAVDSAEWSTVRPGETTQAAVRARFGAPSTVTSEKLEGYDTTRWLYEGAQAPTGAKKVTIDFGLLTPQGYKPDVVRQMLLEPKPGIFTRKTVLDGWGEPDIASVERGRKFAAYRSGLVVYFDKEGVNAEQMYFTPPQPPAPGGAPSRR